MWSPIISFFRDRVLTLENLLAVVICVMVILIVIFTTDSSPQWIYQGF